MLPEALYELALLSLCIVKLVVHHGKYAPSGYSAPPSLCAPDSRERGLEETLVT